jgi:hypothetical protein
LIAPSFVAGYCVIERPVLKPARAGPGNEVTTIANKIA